MASWCWIPWPSLNHDNPENGFHHFAKLQRDFDSVEACLRDNGVAAVPGYLFETLSRSFKDLGEKIDPGDVIDIEEETCEVKEEETKEDKEKEMTEVKQEETSEVEEGELIELKEETCKVKDLYPSDQLNPFLPLCGRDLSMIRQTSIELNSDILTVGPIDEGPSFSQSPLEKLHDRTYAVVVNNVETDKPELGDLRIGFESVARFIINANADRLPSLKNIEDIKNIQWNTPYVSGKRICSLNIEFRTSKLANQVIARGLRCTGDRIHDCVMHRKLCANCYAYGHSINICVRPTRCGRCAEHHPTTSCRSVLFKCAICGGCHASSQCKTPVEYYRPRKPSRSSNKLHRFEPYRRVGLAAGGPNKGKNSIQVTRSKNAEAAFPQLNIVGRRKYQRERVFDRETAELGDWWQCMMRVHPSTSLTPDFPI